MFTIKAKDNMKVLYIDYEVLEELRETHPDLDKEMEAYEKYIEEYGLPICDYSIPYKRNVKTKFKNAVRRAITFNAYKHKKKSKLSRLIEDLRKQKKEYEEKGEKKIKREEFKNELADLIYEKIKNIIPNSDDSQAYIMEIFKYINKKMEEVTNTLVEQNDFIGYELGDDESQYHSELDNLEDLENLDLFNDSKEEQKVEKTEGEKINDSFADYFGLGNSHQDQINKAKEQMKEYKLSQSRRKSKKSSHAALDNFLKIDTNEGMSEQSAVLDSERSYPRLTSKEKQEAIDHVRNLNGDHW
mmetsp:Transcript_20302/g.19987  ORF Transcript_20302/g.19987 Transcript_20302/m.19987 type:complete len:300 (+) Transcript_20302:812-1711(+)